MDARTIETTRFGDRTPEAPDNFDLWSQHSYNHDLARASDDPFRAEASFWQLDRIVVTEQWLGAFAGARTPARLAAVPTKQVTLVVLLDAAMRYRDADGERHGASGDIVLLDFRRSYDFTTGAGRTMTISMDRGLLEDDLGPLRIAGLLPRTPESGMLADFAATLATHLPALAAASVVPVATVLRRIIVLALARCHPQGEAPVPTGRAEALAYIERQPPGRLDVAAMTDALGLTRATLYRMFRSDGGVLAYDRRRRLRLLHRSLSEEDPGISLGELGARHGFLDLSHLSRLFRAHFGLSMSEVRMHLTPRAAGGESVGRYRDAITQFA